MEWINVKHSLPCDERVIGFSPLYEKDHFMRYRIVDGQFVKSCIDITHWMPLTEPTVLNFLIKE